MNFEKHYREPNILLVDKPKGPTSFDVIRFLRRELQIKKMGHAGTLDPLASGLMIIGTNEGTKQMEGFLKLSKVYEADILLGKETTTGDLEGEVMRSVVCNFQVDQIEDVVAGFRGVHELAVPLYSAIKVDGKPLYKYAREGKTPPRIPMKEMGVTDVQFLKTFEDELGQHVVLEITVSSGTYIRSLAVEFGRRLEVPATLAGLRRTSIGEFSVEDALPLRYVDGRIVR